VGALCTADGVFLLTTSHNIQWNSSISVNDITKQNNPIKNPRDFTTLMLLTR